MHHTHTTTHCEQLVHRAVVSSTHSIMYCYQALINQLLIVSLTREVDKVIDLIRIQLRAKVCSIVSENCIEDEFKLLIIPSDTKVLNCRCEVAQLQRSLIVSEPGKVGFGQIVL